MSDVLETFEEMNIHWHYWTFKAVKNNVCPDGLFSFYENPQWVNRMGKSYGWDNYAELWDKHHEEIIQSWRSDHFLPNEELIKVIQKYAPNP